MALKKLDQWLKNSVEEMQARQGFCSLLNRHYATIDAIRVNCLTGDRQQAKVHWRLDLDSDGKKVLRILDGVTGYESWYLNDLIEIGINSNFCACAGTRGRWDELWLNPEQMKNLVNELKEIKEIQC